MDLTRMRCETLSWFLLQAFSLIWLAEVSHANKTYYLEDYPSFVKMEITLPNTSSKDSSIVILGSRKSSPSNGKFQLTIVPPKAIGKRFGLVCTVQEFNIGRNGWKCTDQIQIYRPYLSVDNLFFSGCSNMPRSFVVETPFQDHLLITLDIGHMLTTYFKFQMTVTTYNPCHVEELKNRNEFYCSNGKCINDKLKCNQRDNCGNDSDESKKTCSNSNSGSFKTGIAIAVVVVLVIAAIAGFRYHRRRQQPTVTTMTTFPVSQPTQYNYPATIYPVQPPVQPPQPWTQPYPANQQQASVNPEYSEPPPPYYNQTLANSNINRY